MLDLYARMSVDECLRLQPSHLHSELDDASDGADRDGQAPPVLQGFTEWTAPGERTLTFGWDWTFEPGTGEWSGHWGTLRTNLVVTDPSGADLGDEKTQDCVSKLMARAGWARAVADVLRLYPPH